MEDVVRRTAEVLTIPFTVGGGLATADHLRRMLRAGADKVAVNTAAVRRPDLIREGAEQFGSQCIVVAIDAKRTAPGAWEVYTHGGRAPTGLDAVDWAVRAAERGAGEILLTSMDQDGREDGFDLALTRAVTRAVRIPVIASGGAGLPAHFVEAVREADADAVLAASIFHYRTHSIAAVKHAMAAAGIPVRPAENPQLPRSDAAMGGADKVTYDAAGLVTAVAQDAATGRVLMVAHMTREALERTLATQQAWYWSRSRRRLWRKGETSGHTQRVLEVRGDCDGDAILLQVEQAGPACHTGRRSCFFRAVEPGGGLVDHRAGDQPVEERRTDAQRAEGPQGDGATSAPAAAAGSAGPEILTELAAVLSERRRAAKPGSYTSGLYAEGLARLNEKIMEEAAEVARAARKETSGRLVEEAADLWFHVLALLVYQGVDPRQIFAELARRRR
jgi:cyclase